MILRVAPARVGRVGASPEPAPVRDPVRGTVLGTDERPVPRARVTLFRRTREWPRQDRVPMPASVHTGPDGRFEFGVERSRDLEVQVEADGLATEFVQVSPRLDDLVVRLDPGFQIVGRVLRVDDAPCGDCEVFLEPRGGNRTRAFATRTDARGDFVLSGIPVEDFRLVARHPNSRPVEYGSVPIGQRRTYSLKFGAASGLGVSGKVLSSDTGAPLANSVVLVYPNLPNGFLSVPYRTQTGDDGVFRVRGLGPGAYKMEIRHPKHSTRERLLSLKSRSVTGLQVELQGRAQVRGTVRGFARPGGQRLRLVSFVGEIGAAEVQADGTFAFEDSGFSRGLAEFELQDDAYSFKSTNSRWSRLEISGEEDAEVQFEVVPAATTVGKVTDPDGNPLIGVQVLTPRSKVGAHLGVLTQRPEVLAVTDEKGMYNIRGLEPGERSLLFRKNLYALQSLVARMETMHGSEEVRLQTIKMDRPGTIRGRVTRAGNPVAGAVVSIGRGLRVLGRANTDANGSYTLRGLPPGEHKVHVRFGGLGVEYYKEAVVVKPGATVEGIDIALPKGRQIEGRVSDDDDLPIAGAIIEAESGVVARTDSSGRYKLDVSLGETSLVVRLLRRGPPIRTVTVAADESHVPIRIASARRASIRARVLGLPGRRPVSGVMVRLEPRLRNSSQGPALEGGMVKETLDKLMELQRKLAWFSGMGTEERWVDTDSGAMELPSLPVGAAVLTVRAKGFEPFVGQVDLRAGKPLDLGTIELGRGARVRGVVVDPWGKPISGAHVVLGRESELANPAAQTYYTTDAQGGFVVRGVSHRNKRLYVRMTGFATCRQDLNFPRDVLSPDPIRVQLQPGATIVVDVVDQDGQPLGYEAVRLFRGLEPIALSRTDERGRVEFEHLSKDGYQVMLPGRPRAGVREQRVRDTLGAKRYAVKFVIKD